METLKIQVMPSINYTPSHVQQQKCGELWSTNKKVTGPHVDPPKTYTARAVYRLMQLHSDT